MTENQERSRINGLLGWIYTGALVFIGFVLGVVIWRGIVRFGERFGGVGIAIAFGVIVAVATIWCLIGHIADKRGRDGKKAQQERMHSERTTVSDSIVAGL